jgi:D-glycero-D-manno-heptose 1,7-bisphosphate phosphatase
MDKAVFLDRDGVIIENVDTYVRAWDEVTFLPGAVEALRRLCVSPYKVVLITNQSVIGRGIITAAEAQLINDRIVRVIEDAGGKVDGVFVCPHTPQDQCDCRKPEPGLFNQAARALSVNLAQSIFVGDALTDIQAGRNAGIRSSVLVRTGRGAAQLALPEARSLEPFPVFDRLEDVIGALLSGFLFQA